MLKLPPVLKRKPREVLSPPIAAFLKNIGPKTDFGLAQTAGIERIRFELQKRPKDAEAFATRYNDLVIGIASVIVSEYGRNVGEEQFFDEVWGIMKSNLKIIYGRSGYKFLSESVRTGVFDCDTSAFLVFDIAKTLGIEMDMVSAQSHLFVKTKNCVFETTSGKYYPISKLNERYPVIYGVISDLEQVRLLFRFNRGVARNRNREFHKAIEDFDAVIAGFPNNAQAFSNRGNSYCGIKKHSEALADHNEAIRLDPYLAQAFYNRAIVYSRMQKYEEVVADCSEAIRLNPKYAKAYYNRALAYNHLEMHKSAKADEKKYSELEDEREQYD